MGWEFDQSPDTACFTCKSILAGAEVLLVSHYEEDHSWAFLDGKPLDMDEALLVSMSSVLSAHRICTSLPIFLRVGRRSEKGGGFHG